MGGNAFDVYRVCERMARDRPRPRHRRCSPRSSAATRSRSAARPSRRSSGMSRIADEGILMAYGATEPEAGSDLAALKTTAVPVVRGRRRRRLPAHRAPSSGSPTAASPTSARSSPAPGGPSWFVVEQRHRRASRTASPRTSTASGCSNTAALFLDDVYVDADRLVGGVEGQGLVQAQQVFGYTRLMVAAFGLGAGWAALDRAIPYSRRAHPGRRPAVREAGLHPQADRPPRRRASRPRGPTIEETAERIDAGEGSLNTEGAIAKYLATEAGNAAADAAIQALGGYGYTHEYMVEKIKRDVRITTIYEGTSEIMEMTIARGPLAGAPQDPRRPLPRAAPRARGPRTQRPRRRRRHRRPRPPRAGRGPRGVPRRRGSPATSTSCCGWAS